MGEDNLLHLYQLHIVESAHQCLYLMLLVLEGSEIYYSGRSYSLNSTVTVQIGDQPDEQDLAGGVE